MVQERGISATWIVRGPEGRLVSVGARERRLGRPTPSRQTRRRSRSFPMGSCSVRRADRKDRKASIHFASSIRSAAARRSPRACSGRERPARRRAAARPGGISARPRPGSDGVFTRGRDAEAPRGRRASHRSALRVRRPRPVQRREPRRPHARRLPRLLEPRRLLRERGRARADRGSPSFSRTRSGSFCSFRCTPASSRSARRASPSRGAATVRIPPSRARARRSTST